MDHDINAVYQITMIIANSSGMEIIDSAVMASELFIKFGYDITADDINEAIVAHKLRN